MNPDFVITQSTPAALGRGADSMRLHKGAPRARRTRVNWRMWISHVLQADFSKLR